MTSRASLSRTAEGCIVIARYIDDYGQGMPASELGAKMWPGHEGRPSSVHGGGRYAAQMLLGRMRKSGLVRTTDDPGSSRWELTAKGRKVADLTSRAYQQAAQLDATDAEVSRFRRRLDDTETEIAVILGKEP